VKRSISPGPGNYPIPSTLSTQKWSIRMRTKDNHSSALQVPGPGTYRTINGINEKGNYFVSKFKNSCASVISPSSNVEKKDNLNPGPGHYDYLKTCLSAEGKYFISKFKSSKVKTFSKQPRQTLTNDSITPGPGIYNAYSEFGYLKYQKPEAQ
jgi:hypothetical protein